MMTMLERTEGHYEGSGGRVRPGLQVVPRVRCHRV
jgi:hypothetical protein